MKKLLILLFFILLSQKASAQDISQFRGVVNSDDVNIRSDSTVGANVICKAKKGDYLDITSQLYDWYKVKLPKSAPAYIKKDFVGLIEEKPLEPVTAEAVTAPDTSKTPIRYGKVLKDRVNIRLSPSETSPVIGKTDKNEIINIVEEADQWYKIKPVDSCIGWINKRFVEKAGEAGAGEGKQAQKVQKATTQTKELISEEAIIVEGTITPYGKVFRRKTTHKLVSAGNKIYFLKGEKKSLDVLNYKKVRIIGKLVSSPKEKIPVIEIEKTELLD